MKRYRILVCGGRDFDDKKEMKRVMKFIRPHMKVLIHGDCRGADRMAGRWAEKRNIRVKPFPANWKELGKKAGPIRNRQMLKEGKPHIVIFFPGNSGTADMCRAAIKRRIPTVAATMVGREFMFEKPIKKLRRAPWQRSDWPEVQAEIKKKLRKKQKREAREKRELEEETRRAKERIRKKRDKEWKRRDR